MKKLLLTAAALLAATAPPMMPSRAEAAATRLAVAAGTFPPSTLTFPLCTSRGQAALTRLGFRNINTSVSPTISFADGPKGDVVASVTCAAGPSVTFVSVSVAGPVLRTVQQLRDSIVASVVPPSPATGRAGTSGWITE